MVEKSCGFVYTQIKKNTMKKQKFGGALKSLKFLKVARELNPKLSRRKFDEGNPPSSLNMPFLCDEASAEIAFNSIFGWK
jgi:hypothetical protein